MIVPNDLNGIKVWSGSQSTKYELKDKTDIKGGFIGNSFEYSVYRMSNNGIFVLKIPGRMAWFGLGDLKYYFPELWVGFLRGGIYHCTHVITYNRKTKKGLKSVLSEVLDSMEDIMLRLGEENGALERSSSKISE